MINPNQSHSQNGAIRGVIFDFDGLILDTETPIFESWQEVYRACGGELSMQQWSTIIGTISDEDDPFVWLEGQVRRPVDRKSFAPQRRQREFELIQSQPVRPGVMDCLLEAKKLGLKTGVASSSPCKWVVGHLTRLGIIDEFDCVRASDDVARVKPDPDLYRAVLAELDLHPDQAIALEDSPIGVTAALRAGLFVVAVPNELTRQMDLSHASLRVDSLADLPLASLLQKVAAAKAGA
jgi:HAD superfamily hydrolase (TIGR01509 family)